MTADLGKNLIGLEHLSAEQILLILDTAEPFKEVSERPIKKVPALRGKTIVNLFFEASTYFVFVQSLDPGLIWSDTVKHPRIAVGFVAFLLLIPLALTSTDASVRWLGKRWVKLHRLIYAATALGVLQYLMVQKLDIRKGLIYAVVFGGLMLFRIPLLVKRPAARTGAQPAEGAR